MKLAETSLLDIVPRFMQEDITVQCLAASADYIKRRLLEKIPIANLLDNLDLITEEDLDYIAKAEEIPWYDTGYEIDKKRNCIKNFEKECMILGTPQAVKDVIQDLFGEMQIKEWFEYGGAEKHFKIDVDVLENTEKIEETIREKLRYVKNLRSRFDEIGRLRGIAEGSYYGCAAAQTKTAYIEEG